MCDFYQTMFKISSYDLLWFPTSVSPPYMFKISSYDLNWACVTSTKLCLRSISPTSVSPPYVLYEKSQRLPFLLMQRNTGAKRCCFHRTNTQVTVTSRETRGQYVENVLKRSAALSNRETLLSNRSFEHPYRHSTNQLSLDPFLDSCFPKGDYANHIHH